MLCFHRMEFGCFFSPPKKNRKLSKPWTFAVPLHGKSPKPQQYQPAAKKNTHTKKIWIDFKWFSMSSSSWIAHYTWHCLAHGCYFYLFIFSNRINATRELCGTHWIYDISVIFKWSLSAQNVDSTQQIKMREDPKHVANKTTAAHVCKWSSFQNNDEKPTVWYMYSNRQPNIY